MIEHLHKLYQAGNTLAEVQTHLRGRGLDSIKAKRYATLRVCNTTPKEHIKATASALKKYVEDQTTVDPALVAELTRVATGTVQGQKQRETIQGFTNAEIRAIFYKVVPKNRNGKRVQMVTPVSLRQAARNSRVNRASACGPHISVYAVNQPAFPSASEVASTVVFKHPLLRRRASV